MKNSRFVLLSLLLCGFLSPAVGSGEITIGTGSSSGIYYQSGRAICRLMNEGTDTHGIICAPKISPGSISNLKRVRNGELELGVVQSDAQYHAVNGSGKFSSTGPDQGLRSLFSLHDEAFTLVARSDSGIKSFDDLRGKRVNIGNPGSGQLATMEEVMKLKGWDHSIFSLANQLPAKQQSMALCHNRVQAMVYMVGHPNPSVAQAESLCNAVIIEVNDSDIDRLVEAYPFYTYANVPGGLYAGNPNPVRTFGVKATMVASKDLDADTVYEVVKAVFGNLDKFRNMHPAFSGLNAEKMVSEGLTAPLHAGALRYYAERGWISK